MNNEEKSYLETLKDNVNELKDKAENKEHKSYLDGIKEDVNKLQNKESD